MREFIYANIEHVLCVLVLISRLGDVVSTRLATPKLKLEANPVARKLGWWFIVLTLGFCVVPYFHPGAAVAIFVASSFVAASNILKVWQARALGEEEYHRHMMRVAKAAKPLHAYSALFAAALFLGLCGVTQMVLSGGPTWDWGYWFGMGVVAVGFALALHGSFAYRRLFREGRRLSAESPDDCPAPRGER